MEVRKIAKVAICITIRQDLLEALDLLASYKKFKRSQAVEYMIDECIKFKKQKARELETRDKTMEQDKQNINEMIYKYQQGRPIVEKA